jgi:hypothetical protein
VTRLVPYFFGIACRGRSVIPVRLLIREHGDRTFAHVLAKLRCKQCRKPPAPVYLCAGHREHTMGAPPDWAIELVPVPHPEGRNQISSTSGGSAG